MTTLSSTFPSSDWENKEDEYNKYYEAAIKDTSRGDYERAKRWYRHSLNSPTKEIFVNSCVGLASLLYGRSSLNERERDEAALLLKLTRDLKYEKLAYGIDPDGSRTRRCLLYLLLQGDLSKNSMNALHRSFFHSTMFEIHLLSIITRYAEPITTFLNEEERNAEKREEEEGKTMQKKKRDKNEGIINKPLKYIQCDTSEIRDIVFQDASHVRYMDIRLSSSSPFSSSSSPSPSSSSSPSSSTSLGEVAVLPDRNALSCILNLLISGGHKQEDTYHVDFSGLLCVDFSCLEHLTISECQFDCSSLIGFNSSSLLSLTLRECDLTQFQSVAKWEMGRLEILSIDSCSSLSLSQLFQCDFPSLTSLSIRDSSATKSHISNLTNLKGIELLSTSSLVRLSLGGSRLSDISSLSLCDFSSLKELTLNARIDSLSPLSPCNLSSLVSLSIDFSNVDDLSPLTPTGIGPCLHNLYISGCPLHDLSPMLQWKDFTPISLNFAATSITDISPLSHLNLSFVRSICIAETNVKDVDCLKDLKVDRLDIPETACYDPEALVDITNTVLSRQLRNNNYVSPYRYGDFYLEWRLYGGYDSD